MTPKQRYEIYDNIQNVILMKEYINESTFPHFIKGICSVLTIYNDVDSVYYTLDQLPELNFLKPPHEKWFGSFWFELNEHGLHQRLELLEKAKQMTKTAKI